MANMKVAPKEESLPTDNTTWLPQTREKMVQIHFRDGVPVANGDQFGVGRAVRAER